MTRGGPARRFLLPLVPVYRLALAWRARRLGNGSEQVGRLGWPVISIGNLSTGGSGKTPLTIALARALQRKGIAVDVLSRGYGRSGRGPARVDPDGSAEAFGDEPLLIARSAGVPVYVARQRYGAGALAESAPAITGGRTTADRVHILDDGFQHRQLHRDVDIVLLNREDWEDRLLPAGNLREELKAVKRASVLAIPADDSGFEEELRAWGWEGPVWRLRRKMTVPDVDGPAVAFCGIARPAQFFAGLVAAGVELPVRIAYPDHHRFTARNLQSLVLAARSHRSRSVITTEKDRVRLGSMAGELAPELPVLTAGLEVQIEDEAAAADWILARLKAHSIDASL